ncbi:MAG TPA: 16S rRNA (guanine(527)-N(7))-methyltransferase RsmG [bacterium (Candidatus Stahlbacteria)]|nr:16S rRNA (guanine(527)-N(7))-methyltransferase RsmG [Candidatus Stahlbacteria bacterium]
MFNIRSFKKQAHSIGIKLKAKELEKFNLYFDALLSWNKRINLVSRRDAGRIEFHFLDSLFASRFIESNTKVLDIGAGAGFPSIPIRIFRDDITLSVCESKRKKYLFLKYLVELLELENVTLFCERAESLRNSYDTILEREIGKLKYFVRIAYPLLGSHGKLIAYKGNNVDVEIEEALPYMQKVGIGVKQILKRPFGGKLLILGHA